MLVDDSVIFLFTATAGWKRQNWQRTDAEELEREADAITSALSVEL